MFRGKSIAVTFELALRIEFSLSYLNFSAKILIFPSSEIASPFLASIILPLSIILISDVLKVNSLAASIEKVLK